MKPSPELIEPVANLRRLCLIGFDISPFSRGFQGRTNQQFYAQLLFARLVMTAISVLRLLQSEEPDESTSPLLDPNSVASLTRNLIECYEVFYYLGIERVHPEEEEFRSLLWSLCYDADYDRIISKLGVTVKNRSSFRDVLHQRTRTELMKNPVFNRLTPRQQTDLLRAKKPIFGSVNNKERWRYLNQEKVKGLYKYLSNYVHMHPVAVEMSIPLIFKRSLDNEFLVPTCVEAITQHFCLAILQFIRKLRRYADQITPADIMWIRDQLDRPSVLR